MNVNEVVSAELTRQEWNLVMLALGELPTKHTYSLVKKLEQLLEPLKPNADP